MNNLIRLNRMPDQGNSGAMAGMLAPVISQGMDLAVKPIYDNANDWLNRRNINQQLSAEKSMVDYTTGKQMDMWNNTNYEAQVGHMEKAGLNPGLLYGKGGGGGATTGSPQTGNVSTGYTEESKQNNAQAMGVGLQAAMTQAQIDNIKADTKNKEADTTKKAGVDTENVKANTRLTGVNTELQQVAASVSRQTIGEQMQAIVNNVQKQEAEINNTNADTEQIIEQTNTIKEQGILVVMQQALTQAQTNKTTKEASWIDRINDAQLKKWAAEIMQNWTRIERTNNENEVTDEEMYGSGFPQELKDIIGDAVIGKILKGAGRPTINKIGYK